MLFYRAVLPLSRKTLVFVAGIIRRHRACDRVGVAEAEFRRGRRRSSWPTCGKARRSPIWLPGSGSGWPRRGGM